MERKKYTRRLVQLAFRLLSRRTFLYMKRASDFGDDKLCRRFHFEDLVHVQNSADPQGVYINSIPKTHYYNFSSLL